MNRFYSKRVSLWGWVLFLVACFCGLVSAAETKKEDLRFVRIRHDAQKRPEALQTAIVRFGPPAGKTGPTVDLIAAVHVAEADYYESLNGLFKNYDAVLFEMITDAKRYRGPAKEKDRSNPVSAMQGGLKDLLELEFQLDAIDYTPDHFVHADMTPEEFKQSMRTRNESFLDLFLRMIGYGMSGASKGQDARLWAAFLAKDRAYALRQVFAEQFADLRQLTRVIEGEKGSTILAQRNQKALDVLRREIDTGKARIALFYGAAHLTDMAKQLETSFGLELKSVRWIRAWKLQRD